MPIPVAGKRYGCLIDPPDPNDKFLALATPEKIESLPTSFDFRTTSPYSSYLPPIYDQGNLGSCTSNALAGQFEFYLIKKGTDFTPSRLFIYYNERVILKTVNHDSGAYLIDGYKSLTANGVCSETIWPYIISDFKNKPSQTAYDDALGNKVQSYTKIAQNLGTLQAELAAGSPIAYGLLAYPGLESENTASTGVVPMPGPNVKSIGGHAMVLVGYDNASSCFISRNSWGSDWGQNGYCTMPYAYVTNPKMAGAFWKINSI